MRRPPIVCRRAVQSLQSPPVQHIWISDELLSSTFNRFCRHSRPQQKRHGSHVPGPLEARRRAAKRRMTVSANFYPQDSFPQPFSLGALFGFRSNPQPAWRYEPPSLQQDTEPLESIRHAAAPNSAPSLPVFNANFKSPKPSDTTHHTAYSLSQNVPHIHEEQQTATHLAPVENEIATSVAVSEAAHGSAVTEQSIAAAEAFRTRISRVARTSAVKERNNIVREAFKDCCPASADTSMYTVLVIRYMIELRCYPGQILQQHSTSSFPIPAIQSPEWIGFLVDLEKLMALYPNCVQDIHQIHRSLAESCLSAIANTTTHGLYDRELILLVKQLWQSAYLQGAAFEESATDLLRCVSKTIGHRFRRRSLAALLSSIATVERRIPAFIGKVAEDQSRLSVAVHVLSCVPKARLLKCIPAITVNIAKAANDPLVKSKSHTPLRMHVWLQLLRQLDLEHPSHSKSRVDIAMASLTKYVYARNEQVGRRIHVLLSALVMSSLKTDTADNYTPITLDLALSTGMGTGKFKSGSVDAAFDVFLSQLKKERLPQELLVQTLFDLVVRHAGLFFTLPFLRILEERRLTLADPTSLCRLVEKEMTAIRNSSRKTEKERQQAAFALHICQTVSELVRKLSFTSIPTDLQPRLDTLEAQRQLDHILMRAQTDHALPLVFRNLAADMSVTDSIYLVHQLAHHYSTDNTRTQRESWRALYYLYKYLLQNELHISPLFSKAIVRVSIIRPMTENRFVSARRLIWVCHLVARVEGEAVAKQVEASLWEWRGELIKYAKTVYVGVGGHRHDKAHIGTMKKLGLI